MREGFKVFNKLFDVIIVVYWYCFVILEFKVFVDENKDEMKDRVKFGMVIREWDLRVKGSWCL